MGFKIKLYREWGCTPLGGKAVSFAPGVYSVPEQMSAFLADRCLRSGRGQKLEEPASGETAARRSKGAAPENKLRAS